MARKARGMSGVSALLLSCDSAIIIYRLVANLACAVALDSLGVSTGQRRRGIGRKLLEHGIELATAQGRDCYLLATPYGQPLYLAAGFQEMRSVNLFGVEYKSMHRLRRSN